MPSWKTAVQRQPTKQECFNVAAAFLAQAAPSVQATHRDFIAEVCAWNAVKSRDAGDLDWPDEVQNLRCAEFDQFWAGKERPDLDAGFTLSRMAWVRMESWVVLTLSQFGQAVRTPQRQADDERMAAERFDQAQQLDLNSVAAGLANAFAQELGPNWRQDPAAHHLFERLMRQRRVDKARSMDDFRREVASFMQDKYSLMVHTCPHCQQMGKSEREIAPLEENLPPYDFACSCSVSWAHDWVFEPREDDTPERDALVDAWVKANVKGLSVSVPTIAQMVEFEAAAMRDRAAQSPVESASSPLQAQVDASTLPRKSFSLRALGRWFTGKR